MQPRLLIPDDRPWRVLGLMSGTSADGVDVVAIEVDSGGFRLARPFRRLLGHQSVAYPASLREQVLAAASDRLSPGGLCILQRRLGDHHAAAARTLCEALALRPDLAALHGQTVQHHPAQGASLQLADPYVLAEALDCPVVWDLRRRDLALGGQGAPLVPLPERWLHGPGPWLALNLGGLANLTLWDGQTTRAWDTGPGMSLLDLAAQRWLGRPFDPEGASAGGAVAEAPPGALAPAPLLPGGAPEIHGPRGLRRGLAGCRNPPFSKRFPWRTGWPPWPPSPRPPCRWKRHAWPGQPACGGWSVEGVPVIGGCGRNWPAGCPWPSRRMPPSLPAPGKP